MRMETLRMIWRELNDPRGGALVKPYLRAVSAGGHALLGAVFAGGNWWVGVGVAVAYWLWKERGDLRRGGAWLDGIEDTVMVWLGTFYGPWWWPAMMVGCMGYIMFVSAWRSAR